jgi:hypothetical protein
MSGYFLLYLYRVSLNVSRLTLQGRVLGELVSTAIKGASGTDVVLCVVDAAKRCVALLPCA